MSDRTGRGLLALLAVLTAVAGCAAPGPLSTLLNHPQTDSDRIDSRARPFEVDPDSTRFLAEHDGLGFWVGRESERGVLCLIVVEDEENGHSSCGNPPVGLGGEWGDAWLLPDGMDPRAIEGTWTSVTPNLLVR